MFWQFDLHLAGEHIAFHDECFFFYMSIKLNGTQENCGFRTTEICRL